ncbi:uncharacterized protein [Ptychodera flava]|uniref:uncharacterized protein n=1 Tax=Ptychodera flava TaxID=63121 RepID=UPI00396A20CC
MSSQSEQSVTKDGYLWRYGGFPIKKWKYWYVTLTCDSCKGVRLKFFATPEDSTKMSFSLKMSTLKVGSRCKEEMTRALKHFDPLECNGHVFAITGSDGKRHYIMADSSHELREWLEGLRQAHEAVALARQLKDKHKHNTWGVRMTPKKTFRQYSSTGTSSSSGNSNKFFSEPEFGSQYTLHKEYHPTLYGLYDGHHIHVGSGLNTVPGFQLENKAYSDFADLVSPSACSDISAGSLDFSGSCGSPDSIASSTNSCGSDF